MKRNYDIDFNKKNNCFEFYIIKEHNIIKGYKWGADAHLLGELYKENGNFILKVLNGKFDTPIVKEIKFFGISNEKDAIDLSKKYLDRCLI